MTGASYPEGVIFRSWKGFAASPHELGAFRCAEVCHLATGTVSVTVPVYSTV